VGSGAGCSHCSFHGSLASCIHLAPNCVCARCIIRRHGRRHRSDISYRARLAVWQESRAFVEVRAQLGTRLGMHVLGADVVVSNTCTYGLLQPQLLSLDAQSLPAPPVPSLLQRWNRRRADHLAAIERSGANATSHGPVPHTVALNHFADWTREEYLALVRPDRWGWAASQLRLLQALAGCSALAHPAGSCCRVISGGAALPCHLTSCSAVLLFECRSAKRLLAAEQPGVRLHQVSTPSHMVPAEGALHAASRFALPGAGPAPGADAGQLPPCLLHTTLMP